MSEEMIFNYPCEFMLDIFIINDETGQKGAATVSIGNFEHPTPDRVKSEIDHFSEKLKEQGLDGFRVMTKREAWDYVCIQKAGSVFAMPGSEDFDEVEI